MEKQYVTIIGVVRGKDVFVQFPRPTIIDQNTKVKYDLPCNLGATNIYAQYKDKKVCVEGYLLPTKTVGEKTYNKVFVESIEEVQ